MVHAQLVSDGATNTLSNITTNVTGTVTIGTNGTFTLLVLSDNTLLTNSANGIIGRNATAKSNAVQLISSTSRWRMGGALFVGSNGALSRLVVSNGALLENLNGNLGFGTASSNNSALITGVGSLWTNRGSFTIANGIFGSSSNRLVVSDGAALVAGGAASVSGFGNEILVTGAGSQWESQSDFTFGGAANRLELSNGARLISTNAIISALNSGPDNLVLLSNAGTIWTNGGNLTVGFGGARGVLRAAAGAQIFVTGHASLGAIGGANFNSVSVADPGASWTIGSDLYVGSGGSANSLAISNGGFVVSSNAFLGLSLGASGNSVSVVGATSVWSNRHDLIIGDAAGNNQLLAAGGAVVLTGGDAVLGARSGVNANSATVTDLGSRWQVAADLYIGSNGPLNRLVITNGGYVENVSGVIGARTNSINNQVIVTGAGSTWTNSSWLYVGKNGVFNRLVVSDSGQLRSGGCYIGDYLGFLGPTNADNNEALITGAGSLWLNSPGSLFVGGSRTTANRLVISNGASMLNGIGYLGFQATNNLVLITGNGSTWSNSSFVFVGQEGTGNRLLVTNGAAVFAAFVEIGRFAPANGNQVRIDGGSLQTAAKFEVLRGTNFLNSGLMDLGFLLLTNAQGFFEFNGGTLITHGANINNGRPFNIPASGTTPAVWDVRAGGSTVLADYVNVGNNTPFNRLLVTNGATPASYAMQIGFGANARSNTATISGPGSRWTASTYLSVGFLGSFNSLLISNGASVNCAVGEIGSGGSAARENQIIVTGHGSSLEQSGDLVVGYTGPSNRVMVSNGGLMRTASTTIGVNPNCFNNLAVVSGAGSMWSNAGTVFVGYQGAGNELVVTNGATVTVGEALHVGFEPTALTNRVLVSGSTLLVTNATTTGLLEIHRGTQVLNTGLVEVDILRMTNGALSKFDFRGGTLSIKSSRVNIGNPLIVGDGTNPATLQLAGNGTHDFSGTLGLIITNNATLTGAGSLLVQLQVRPGATLAPGVSVGKISLSTPPLLSGATVMEISKNGATLTNDQIQVAGTVTYGGALTVTLLGPTSLAQGDKFQLFNATAYAGSFTALTLPPLPPGLRWVNNLLVDGSIEVFAPPPVGAGFALNFDGTNDFVRVSHDSRLNAFPLVATAWINTTQSIGEVGIFNKYVAASFNGWHVGLTNGEVRAWYARDNANRVGNPGSGVKGGSISDGQWHHVAFTVDATGGSLYVDGSFKEKLSWIGTPGVCTTTQEMSFARYPGGSGEFFKGAIEEVAIWNSEKTTGEIKTNLNRSLLGSEVSLVSYHRFNEGAGIVAENAANATGTLTQGFLQNGVAWVPGLTLRPALMTKLATAVTEGSATLHGVSNPSLANTTAWFEWGTTTNYGSTTPFQLLGSGGSNTNFSQSITGLTENVTYHFRAVASNIVGASFGADKIFVATSTNLLNPRVQHTATLLPNGKVLVVGGRSQDYDPLASAEVFDPVFGTWAFTSPMSIVRYDHTATLLPNGKVLVAGGQGQDFTPAHASAELYDPVTGMWTPTGSMATNRSGHTATLLFSGKVLVAGGSSSSSLNTIAELYDPATGNWTASGTLVSGRHYHTTTLLPNGKVLIAGGRDGNNSTVSSAELYDPLSATWTNTGAMTTNRYNHTATLLRNGKVLVVGGRGLVNFLNSAELYDPVADTWAATGAMLNYRFGHTATLLPNGKVFACGDGIGVPSVYNPLTGTWTDVPGPDPNSGATATLLPSGNVLIAGGSGNFFTDFDPTADAEVYITPNSGSWAVTAPMANARDGHTATLLPNALVLVASYTNSEIYNPVTGTWSNTAALNSGRNNHTATLLPNGKVLVAGGINFVTLPGVELYDLTSGSWTNTGSLVTNRIGGHTATLLFNGKVLVAGGNGDLFGPPLRNAELFDSMSGTWTPTGLLTTNRSGHSATLLSDGKVLLAGGLITGGFFPSATATAELYDPATGLWTALPPMGNIRSGHIAIRLPNGKVLVAGGSPSSLSAANVTAELYDPATGTWQATGSMITGRQGATATLLSNGKVLVAGGYNLGYLASAELFDPTTGTWTATAALGAAHMSHTSTLLPTGKVLITGGNFGSGTTNRAELYDVGLGFSNSWRPQITAITSPVGLGDSLVLTGAQFRGLSGASGGNGSQDSPSDYPLVQVRSLEGNQTAFVLPSSWSTNTFASAPVSGFPPGWAMATVFVNGIPSQSSLLSVFKPTATVTLNNLLQVFDGTPKSVSVITVPPGLPVAVTYAGSPNPPTHVGSYLVVGTITDPNYDSSPATNTLVIVPARDFGVDVSHFQNEGGVPQASWNQMFAEGKRFVFIKATEGLTGPHDPTMAINVQRASAAGLLVGVYHFAHPENRPTTNGAILEASNMVFYAGSAIGPGRLRPVLDLEFNAATLSTTALTDWAIAFCNEIIARRGPGAAPIIYCNQTFANNELDSRLADYDLWLRTVGSGANPALDNPPGVGFADATGVFNNWSFWQYSSTGSSGGISPLDLNVCHNEFKSLESFLITNVWPEAIQLIGTGLTGAGAFQFSFTNVPGGIFTALTATNLALPLNDWAVLGSVVETSPGQYQFVDIHATTNAQRYYRVRSP